MVLNNFFKGIHRLLYFMEYLCLLCRYGFSNPFNDSMNKKKHDKLMLLSNGPSLKNFLSVIFSDKMLSEYDFLIVNDFVKSPYYERIRPSFCVWSDPMFFIPTILEERAKYAIEQMAERTKWEMTIFIPQNYKKSHFLNPLLLNKNITLIGYRPITYNGFDRFRHFFMSRGLSGGMWYGNVSVSAVYVALMLKYKEISVYGIDYTFFEGLCVNEKNELCMRNKHFFDEKEAELKPIMCHYAGFEGVYKVSYYINEMAARFKGHDVMSEYAKKENIKIYNCVPNSLIDSYERI